MENNLFVFFHNTMLKYRKDLAHLYFKIYRMKTLFFVSLLLICHTFIHGQSSYQTLESKNNVSIKYKWKLNQENKKLLLIKFKNQSTSHQNINIELGFYLNGIMEEKVQVASCAKKGFFNNLFLTVYGVMSEHLENHQIEDDQFKLIITDFNLEETQACEKQHQ